MNFQQIYRAIFATICLSFTLGAYSQEYPTRPVKMLVGYVPGGGPDMVARALAQKLSEIMGQPFVVENKPGAGGTLATGIAAKSPADGYTLLVGETGQLVIAPYIYKNLSYKTLTDFSPIALVSSEPLLLVSGNKSGIKTLQNLVERARSNPGALSYGSSGVGTIHHIAGEVFKSGLGLSLLHVPYKGSGQSVPAILSGDVPILVTSFAGAGSHIRAGTLNLLAVTTAERLPSMPNVPAVSELIKGYEFPSEVGVLAPAGLPPAVLNKLAAAIKAACDSPDFVAKFKETSTIITYKSPSDYTDNLRINLQKYADATKLSRINPE